MKSRAYQTTPTPVLDLLPSLLTTKTNRPLCSHLVVFRGLADLRQGFREHHRGGGLLHILGDLIQRSAAREGEQWNNEG